MPSANPHECENTKGKGIQWRGLSLKAQRTMKILAGEQR